MSVGSARYSEQSAQRSGFYRRVSHFHDLVISLGGPASDKYIPATKPKEHVATGAAFIGTEQHRLRAYHPLQIDRCHGEDMSCLGGSCQPQALARLDHLRPLRLASISLLSLGTQRRTGPHIWLADIKNPRLDILLLETLVPLLHTRATTFSPRFLPPFRVPATDTLPSGA